MVVNNKQYDVNLSDINSLRYLLFTNFYSDERYIAQLLNIIQANIESLDISFDQQFFTITVKIKKTAMRKMPKFKHEPNYYYAPIQNIFKTFIQSNEVLVRTILSRNLDNDMGRANAYLNYVYSTPGILANLCHVSCMADNILVIKL